MPFNLPPEYLVGMAVWFAAGVASFVFLLKFRRRGSHERPVVVRRLANVGLSLWMLLAALTLVDLCFAIFFDQTDSFNMSNVSKHWFARHVRENGSGFRDARPFPRAVPSGMRRVCFVGDSFTWGHGIKNVSDRFSDRVGARLEAARPGKFLVSNIASPGIHVQLVENLVETIAEDDPYLIAARQLAGGIKGRGGYKIDVLVYTICLNDIEGFKESETDMQARLDFQSPKFFLLRDTYFLNMLYFRVQQARLPDVRNYYSDLARFYGSDAWNAVQATLDDLRGFCRNHHIDLRIAIFPFLHNLGPDYPFDVAHERIAEWCREKHVPCLDLKPVLLSHIGEGLTVNRFDAHPNERAHALAAAAMEKDLLADLFTESPAPLP